MTAATENRRAGARPIPPPESVDWREEETGVGPRELSRLLAELRRIRETVGD